MGWWGTVWGHNGSLKDIVDFFLSSEIFNPNEAIALCQMYSNLMKKDKICLQFFSTPTRPQKSRHLFECQVRKLTVVLNLGFIWKICIMGNYFF